MALKKFQHISCGGPSQIFWLCLPPFRCEKHFDDDFRKPVSDDPGRNPADDCVRWYVITYQRVSTNNRTRSNRHTVQDDRTIPYPDVIHHDSLGNPLALEHKIILWGTSIFDLFRSRVGGSAA